MAELKEQVEKGALYVVAGPIGNLADFTYRAVHILQQVDTIYAEDTRVTGILLQRYEIKKPLRSYREAATPERLEKTIKEIIFDLEQGKSIAYLSDAGTPGISDPVSVLVEKVALAGFKTIALPGASALASLLSVGGIGISRPLFVGFLPKKKGRQTLLGKLKQALQGGVSDCIVIYESPERTIRLLDELLLWELPLEIVLGRELTKLHEEVLRGSVEEVKLALVARKVIKGEVSLLVKYKG